MYFLETNYTRVQRGIVKRNSKILSKAKEKKICNKFEAGDYLCMADSNANEVKELIMCPSENNSSNSDVVSVSA